MRISYSTFIDIYVELLIRFQKAGMEIRITSRHRAISAGFLSGHGLQKCFVVSSAEESDSAFEKSKEKGMRLVKIEFDLNKKLIFTLKF